jgi:hypothetical protein
VLALQFIQLFSRAKIPVISYFCELRREDRILAGNKTMEVQAIICLGYAIARQMIELVLPQFSSKADFAGSRFAQLDGTAASWHELLALLGDLAPLMPATVYIIIDGLHWLDDSSTECLLEKLIASLRKRGNGFRVLLTTSGRSGVLLEQMSIDEVMRVQNDSLQGESLILDRAIFL